MLSYLQKLIEVKLLNTIDKELCKTIVEDSTYGKMILKALIFQIRASRAFFRNNRRFFFPL